jgi:3-oxoadipate enol-lactonase
MAFLKVDDVRIHYELEGPRGADPLVLLNSLGTDLHMWDPQMPAFVSSFHVLRFDSRGHGRSDAPEGVYSVEGLGGDLVALLDALDIDSVHVCGVSLGGMVALWLAATDPARVGRAVFASTAERIGTAERWEARAAAVRAGGLEAIADSVVEEVFFTEPFRLRHPGEVRRVRDTLTGTAPAGYLGSCLALRDADLRGLVPTIRAPSLIVVGRKDASTPLAQAEELHTHIPQSKLVVVESAAHLCNIEQPERFNEAVLEFLGAGRDL